MSTAILNFAAVEPGLYRGGQPRTDSDWLLLQSLDIQTVIKLNYDTDGSDEGALKLGMKLVRVPISKVQQTLTEPDLEIIRGVAMIMAHRTAPLYVHCTHGQDRTGLIVGAYRFNEEGWTATSAFGEMKQHGFHSLLFGLLKAWADITACKCPHCGTKHPAEQWCDGGPINDSNN